MLTSKSPRVKCRFSPLTSLHSPYLVSYRGICVDAPTGLFAIVMELCEQGTLADYARGKPMAVRQRLLLQAAECLEYLHGQDISHLDVKPVNILVSGDTAKGKIDCRCLYSLCTCSKMLL